MTDRLVTLWSWVGVHRLLMGWAVALLGVAVFGAGVALGASTEDRQFPQRADAPTASAKATALEVVIVGRRGATFVARTAEGDQLVIRITPQTRYRLKSRQADVNAVRRGAKVVVIGRPLGDGVFRARTIAVRGQVRLPEAVGSAQ
jgi:hypothetical protein